MKRIVAACAAVVLPLLALSDGSAQMPTVTVEGTSARGRSIEALHWNKGAGFPILIFGGIHGDERSAGEVAMRLASRWRADPSVLDGAHVILLPIVNPDGWELETRRNANGVDLNRNFPDRWEESDPASSSHGGVRALSESESRLLHEMVRRETPRAILSIHSCSTCGGVNNYDGPAQLLAEAMTEVNRYEPTPEWDAPTPGSFGTFAGKVGGIPTITLEIPREVSGEDELERNVRAVEAFIAAVRGG